MKKFIIFLSIALTLVACTKEEASTMRTTEPAPRDYYFSDLRIYTDYRAPRVDTLITWHLTTPEAIAEFTKLDGIIFGTTSTNYDKGVLWFK